MGRGKLIFKGDNPKKLKKKKKKDKHEKNHVEKSSAITSETTLHPNHIISSTSNVAMISPKNEDRKQPQIKVGKGKITSSGTVLTGHGTNFMSTLQPGDAIILMIGKKEQMRIITMRLSDTSAAISTPFSESIKSPASYSYVCKPRDQKKEAKKQMDKAKADSEELNRSAFGTYASTDAGNADTNYMVFRERTELGNYRIRKEAVEGDVSRTSLLEMRTTKKSDRYC